MCSGGHYDPVDTRHNSDPTQQPERVGDLRLQRAEFNQSSRRRRQMVAGGGGAAGGDRLDCQIRHAVADVRPSYPFVQVETVSTESCRDARDVGRQCPFRQRRE